MKKLILCVLVALISSFALADTAAPAPATWSGAFYYNAKHRKTSAVTLYQLKTFHEVFGFKGIDFQLKAMGGYGVEDATGQLGFSLVWEHALSRESVGFIGFAASADVKTHLPVGFGIIAGIKF